MGQPIRASMPQDVLDAYGCAYPLTYIFAIPPGSSALTAYVRHDPQGNWTALDVLQPGVDGVDGARFDYVADRAYVSAALSDSSDALFLTVRNTAGDDVGTYLGVPRYYDNRQSACVFTWDDWEGDPSDHADCLALCVETQQREVWASVGLNPGGREGGGADGGAGINAITAAQWVEIQTAVDGGFVEPINHGYTHMRAEFYGTNTATEEEDAEFEVGEADAAIKANLTLPPQSRRGANQHVHGWIRPGGSTSEAQRLTLADFRYLADRWGGTPNVRDYPTWDHDQVIFAPVLVSGHLENYGLAALTEVFDDTRTYGLIYIGYSYARAWNWNDPQEDIFTHLDHIAGHDDVWYVGLGHLLLYRVAAWNVTVAQHVNFEAASRTQGAVNGVISAGGGLGTIQAGDVLIAHHGYQQPPSQAPSGWQLISDVGVEESSAWSMDAMWYYVADGSEGTDPQFTFNDGGTEDFSALTIARYSGVDPDDPVGAHAYIARIDVENVVGEFTAPSVTPPRSDSMLVRTWQGNGAGRLYYPSGADVMADRAIHIHAVSGRPSNVFADMLHPGGATGEVAVTSEESSTREIGHTLALNPLPFVPPGHRLRTVGLSGAVSAAVYLADGRKL